MRKVVIGIAAAVTLAAVSPASAQGLWLGVPGFGVGIGVGPTYAYESNPYWGAGYGYEPSFAYQSYAYEPEYEYDSYAYVPDDGYAAYPYGPRTYAYEPTDSYRYGPRIRYSRNYSYSPGVRTTRSVYADNRSVIKRDRGHRAAIAHNTGLRDRRVMRNGSAIGTERESATSRRIRSEEASKALARGPAQDLRQSKSLEAGKTGTGRVRTQTYP